MLHSNNDASSFKLQPVPRPKSKRRPQNPPSILTLSSDAASSAHQGKAAGSDAPSLRSCFEDGDEAATPKASLFNASLPEDQHDVSDDEAFDADALSARRPRSSTISIASASSAKSFPSASVSRLLTAMSPSTPTRRPSSLSSQSPSATVTVMLTNRSPTPSSPLFPRRTIMRSISSTCVNASARSPTSPLNLSPGTSLRKRMGWRGAQSAQLQEETAIIMSPGSPLTPRRAKALHTPTQASISSILDANNDEQVEPLSATLKALGAKRRTERFASTCVPVQSPLTDSPDLDLHGQLKSPYSEAELTGNQEKFELMTATRKIFHLPTWVRFEANHHARTRAAEENRQAAAEFAKLRKHQVKARNEVLDEQVIRGETLPKTSQLGDVAPSSPNGQMLAGFELGALPTADAKNEVKGEGECVINVVRRPTMAALREKRDPSINTKASKSGGMFGAVRSALPGIRPQRRIKDSHPQKTLLLAPAADDPERRDGWGGILTRSSWFPSFVRGPLVSPSCPASDKAGGLKRMILQPSRGGKMDDEWEDIDDPPSVAQPDQPRSFLDLNEAPRFFHRQQPPSAPSARTWFPSFFRPRPAASSTHALVDETELNTWHTRRLKPVPAEEAVSSEMITRPSSIENRPLARRGSVKTRIVMATIIAIVVAALVGNIVIVSRTRAGPQGEGGRRTYDPLVGNILGIGSKGQPNAVPSNVVTAAHLSQP